MSFLFEEFLLEELQKGGKSLHMIHSDETIFMGGTSLAKTTQDIFYDVAKKISSDKPIKGITVKYDGAPAVFAGYDPADGKFFVGTKGVFNKTPKIAKTPADCKEFYTGDLQKKMLAALQYLPEIIPSKHPFVMQGDLMFTAGDVKVEDIDGQLYATCHPNTIKYAALIGSDLAEQWRTAKIGIIFHTVYSGSGSLENYKSSFNFNISELNKSKNVWTDDANIKAFDKTMAKADALAIMKGVRATDKYLTKDVDAFLALQDSIPTKAIGARFSTFWNSYIRKGKNPGSNIYKEYESYVRSYYEEKIIGELKSEKGREAAKENMESLLAELKRNKKGLENAWAWSQEIAKMKSKIIDVLDSMSRYSTFLQMNDGSYKVTKNEGYVAIGETGGAVKLVDRFEFSFANFSPAVLKGWQNAGRT